MKNIPIFTAENGIATLILEEIPHSGRGYVLIRSVWTEAAPLLEECRGFCRACGAEAVYASWDCEPLPADHAYDLLELRCRKQDLPKDGRLVDLVPLTEENGQDFVQIYNTCFASLPGAQTYGNRDLLRMYGEDLGWLARVDGEYAATAEISTEGLEGIAVLPQFRGLGYDLSLAVLDLVPTNNLRLKVADTNVRALALYDRLGFRQTRVLRRWYVL